MKKLSAFLLLCFFLSSSYGQIKEIGFGVGTSNFLGDIGKKAPNGKYYPSDLQASLFRPAAAVFFRYNLNQRFALKGNLSYGTLEGNDRLTNQTEPYSDGWYRYMRNLHFKSHVIEMSAVVEFNILMYEPGCKVDKFTPYVFAGLGFMHFNPKALYGSKWVALQPLGTEGQDLPEYPDRKKYSLIQPVLPLGFGIKYNITHNLALGFEFGHRFTFTDYLDDVSKTYADPAHFDQHYDPEKAYLIKSLANRSYEVDKEGLYRQSTVPGEMRGNPDRRDAYVFSMVTLSYAIGQRSSFACPRRARF